ncbi:hypothetical protein STRAU_5139 [Streptomyces aurantiacus JA 4570]|uniref:Uncharacterized protein n=1 Tax=Streptomyces aurantiacus JA 4570 TaxID=1286094 RepID=S3ZDP5_9ACTN|nr:hypothetical protein STRAU_5139 [Streptomyces aurantiacus JA 4570]
MAPSNTAPRAPASLCGVKPQYIEGCSRTSSLATTIRGAPGASLEE